jgi:hypothetical protein
MIPSISNGSHAVAAAPRRQSEKRRKGKLKVGADINTLKEWKLACPKGDQDLVLPNTTGKIEAHSSIINRGLIPAEEAAGIVVDGKAKYTGLHALRHFYASWCINRPADGGLGLPPDDYGRVRASVPAWGRCQEARAG